MDRKVSKIGRNIEAIIDAVNVDGAIGRSHWDALEIDGNVFLMESQN